MQRQRSLPPSRSMFAALDPSLWATSAKSWVLRLQGAHRGVCAALNYWAGWFTAREEQRCIPHQAACTARGPITACDRGNVQHASGHSVRWTRTDPPLLRTDRCVGPRHGGILMGQPLACPFPAAASVRDAGWCTPFCRSPCGWLRAARSQSPSNACWQPGTKQLGQWRTLWPRPSRAATRQH